MTGFRYASRCCSRGRLFDSTRSSGRGWRLLGLFFFLKGSDPFILFHLSEDFFRVRLFLDFFFVNDQLSSLVFLDASGRSELLPKRRCVVGDFRADHRLELLLVFHFLEFGFPPNVLCICGAIFLFRNLRGLRVARLIYFLHELVLEFLDLASGSRGLIRLWGQERRPTEPCKLLFQVGGQVARLQTEGRDSARCGGFYFLGSRGLFRFWIVQFDLGVAKNEAVLLFAGEEFLSGKGAINFSGGFVQLNADPLSWLLGDVTKEADGGDLPFVLVEDDLDFVSDLKLVGCHILLK